MKWDNLNDILTAEECANFLRVHVNTAKKLLQKGELPAKKIGRQWRINKEDLRNYMGATLVG